MTNRTDLVHIAQAAADLRRPQHEIRKMIDLGMLPFEEDAQGRTFIPAYAIEAYQVPDGVTA